MENYAKPSLSPKAQKEIEHISVNGAEEIIVFYDKVPPGELFNIFHTQAILQNWGRDPGVGSRQQ